MRRREFITVLGAAATWPVAAGAQQRERMRRIGVLMNIPADDPEAQLYLAAFQQGLQELGWTIGRNVRIDHRWGPNDGARVRQQVAELVALAPDVMLFAGGTLAEVGQPMSRVPIVLSQSIDPVGGGIVASLARPGGNITGFTQFEYSLSGKWLQLLKEIAPGVTRVGVLRDSSGAGGVGQWAVIQAFAELIGVECIPIALAGC
jgi:putative ABC transport system substrate-binding protein